MSQYLVKHRIRYKGRVINPESLVELQDALVEHAVAKGYAVKIVPTAGGKSKTVIEKQERQPKATTETTDAVVSEPTTDAEPTK